jgi:hypothetical protein
MLTGDLVRARAYKDEVRCQFLKAGRDEVLADATFLVDLLKRGLQAGCTRGVLEDEIAAEAQIRPDHKVVKGLAKVLLDSTTFELDAPIPPAELREKVFRRGAERAPLALGPNPFGRPTADAVLDELAEELGIDADTIRRTLYADRKSELRVTAGRITEPEALIARYNVALVQSVLLKATSLTVRLTRPPASRVRQLLRIAKFHQLMHRAWLEADDLFLRVDGPASILGSSTRYGLKLATFFPAVLHLSKWTLEAEVKWKKGTKMLRITPAHKLVPHVRDVGGQPPREAQWFRDRYAGLDTDWVLEEGRLPVDLGGQALVMPDFTFRNGDRVAHLEIVGFWRKAYLERRIAALKEHGPGNLILAVSKRLVADKSALDGFAGEVIPFAEVLPSKKVLAAVESVARLPPEV